MLHGTQNKKGRLFACSKVFGIISILLGVSGLFLGVFTHESVYAQEASYEYRVSATSDELVIFRSIEGGTFDGQELEFPYNNSDGDNHYFVGSRAAQEFRIAVPRDDPGSGEEQINVGDSEGADWQTDRENITISNVPVFENEIEDTQETVNPDEDSEENEGEPECEAEGLAGFLVCDLLMFILNGMESMQTWLVQVLFETDPLLSDGTDEPIYEVWSAVRDIANALLAVAFMAIIFSLAFSVNVDAYTIKRIVPKLLVATISIQASFLIAALMVDVTNVLGQGLAGLSDLTLDDMDFDAGGAEAAGTGTGLTLAGIATGVGLAGLLAGGGGSALLMLGLLLLFAVLVLFGALLVVALREVFILMAIALAPIAFLANLLPATEQWFKFWWSNFARLLFMYPFIILMIQFGNIGAFVALSSDRDFFGPILAILMQTVAMASIFFAFKVGGSALTLATQGVSRFARGGGKGGGKGGTEDTASRNPLKKARGMFKKNLDTARRGDAGGLAQAGASPKNYLAQKSKSMPGKMSGIGAGSRGSQSAQNVAAMSATAKTMQDQNFLPDTGAEWAQYYNKPGQLNERIRHLQSTGNEKDARMARELGWMKDQGMQNQQSSAAAAAQIAFSNPGLKREEGNNILKNLSSINDPGLRQESIRSATKAAKEAGRPDFGVRHSEFNPEGRKPEEVVGGMDSKSLVEAHKNSLGEFDQKGNLTQASIYGQTLRDDVISGGESRETLKGALSTASGMAGEKRDAYKKLLGEREYNRLMGEPPQGPSPGGGGGPQQPPQSPTGGAPQQPPQGGGYIVDENNPNTTTS